MSDETRSKEKWKWEDVRNRKSKFRKLNESFLQSFFLSLKHDESLHRDEEIATGAYVFFLALFPLVGTSQWPSMSFEFHVIACTNA